MKDKKILESDISSTYSKNLLNVQSQLNPIERLFSKIIHISILEHLLDFLTRYILGPIPIILGGIFGVLSILVYLIANLYGYALAGSEVICAFAAGWLFGLIFIYIRAGFFGKSK